MAWARSRNAFSTLMLDFALVSRNGIRCSLAICHRQNSQWTHHHLRQFLLNIPQCIHTGADGRQCVVITVCRRTAITTAVSSAGLLDQQTFYSTKSCFIDLQISHKSTCTHTHVCRHYVVFKFLLCTFISLTLSLHGLSFSFHLLSLSVSSIRSSSSSSSSSSTPCPEKNGPPKHAKITLWIENDSHYFSLCDEKPAIYLQCLCEISRQLACPLLRYCFL